MTYETFRPGGLNYAPCRYGTSRLMFRGPKRGLEQPFIAFLGGTETYGKFIPHPFPALVEQDLGQVCVNLGCVNAGPDAYLNDPDVIEVAARASAVVVQVMGAQNMSNRFYTVHPRRNDRFLKASKVMQQIFCDVDFTEFSFTRHMLAGLQRFAPERFAMVKEELQSAWVARMQLLLHRFQGRAVLLWMADHPPDTAPDGDDGLGPDPLFITQEMIIALRELVVETVVVQASRRALSFGTGGMVFSALEAPAAEEVLGAEVHGEAAAALVPVLRALT